MKIIAVEEAKAKWGVTLDEAQSQWVLITRHGRPRAILIGVEGNDIGDLLAGVQLPKLRKRSSRRG